MKSVGGLKRKVGCFSFQPTVIIVLPFDLHGITNYIHWLDQLGKYFQSFGQTKLQITKKLKIERMKRDNLTDRQTDRQKD